jgi:hypothetical protein
MVVIKDLASRLTHVSELVQQPIDYVGYCDASAFGAGGVWFGSKRPLDRIVWRVQWPTDVTYTVVSDSNPDGQLTNSDLEMAGVLLHAAVLEEILGPSGMIGTQAAIGCDNSPSVAWTNRMASRSASPISCRLLRGFAMRQRVTRSAPPAVFHVAGAENTMADVTSRVVPAVATHFHLMEASPNTMCPQTFLTIFDSLYPLPKKRSWHNVQPASGLWSNAILTLRGQQLPLQRWTTKPAPPHVRTGRCMPDNATLTHGCDTNPSPPNKHISWPLPPGFVLASLGMQAQLDAKRWKRPSVTWRKPSCWLAMTTPVAPVGQKN